MSDFATHLDLLATDNDYRRRFGLAPLADDATTPDRPIQTTVGVDPRLFAQVDSWTEERKAHEREAKRLQGLIDEAMDALVDQFAAADTLELKLGARKGTLHSQLRARRVSEDVTGEQVAAALRADGYGYMVVPESYNHQTISAWLRDLERQGRPIPPTVAKVIEGHTKWWVGFTQGRETETQARLNGAPSSVLGGASQD